MYEMFVVNQYAGAMFFFHIIEEVIMYGRDCDQLMYMSDAEI